MMLNKLKLMLAALVLCGGTSYAQKAIVTGNLTGLKQKEIVMIYYENGKSVSDTVKVNNGKFKWVVKMSEPRKVQTVLFDDYFYFFVESGNVSFTGAKSVKGIKITGSKSQLEYEIYLKMVKDIDDQLANFGINWSKASKQEQGKLARKFDDLYRQKNEKADQFITHYPKSAVSVNLISEKAGMGSYGDISEAFKKLDPIAQQSKEGNQISQRLIVLKRSAIGEQMLNFTQNDTEGKPVQYSDFKGKYVLVDFWASWCAPCRAENPNVLKAYNRYKDKNFTVVGVSLDAAAGDWKKAIADDHMPWIQVSDLKGWNNEVSTYFGIQGIPSTLLIDPQGKIVAKNLRGEGLETKLAELFK